MKILGKNGINKKIAITIFIFFCILLILTAFFSCAINQKDIFPDGDLDGFSEINWGSDASIALDIISGKKFSIIGLDDDFILAGYDGSIYLHFCDKGFYVGYIDYRVKENNEYNKIVDMLKEKYGEPSYAADPNEDYYTVWDFDNNCSLSVDYMTEDLVTLFYINDTIYDEVEKGKFDSHDITVGLSFCDMGFYLSYINYWNKIHKYEYKEFVDMLKEKYGEPSYAADPNEDYIYTRWDFEYNCSLWADYNGSVSLSYMNSAILDEVIERRKIKEEK